MAAFKFLVACGVACLGLLLFAGVAMTDGPVGSAYVPKDGEVVAIRSVHTGRYLQVSQTTGKLDANASQPTERTALFRVTLVSHAMVEMLVDAVFTTNKANWATRKQTTQSGCPCSGYSNDHGFGMYCYSWEYEAQTPWCYVLDSCDIKVPTVQTDSSAAAAAATGRGSFGRKYEDCDPFEPDYADEFSARYGTMQSRTIEGFSWESEPVSDANITQQWDDVSNFTGAGDWDIENWGAEERPWEEGERPWWADPTNKFDEGEEEEYRYIGCNCPTYCDTHGYVYRGESFNGTAPPTHPPPPPPPPQPLRVSERGCPCSGFVNSHGFGGHCASWEFEGQRPWCYVQPNCSRDAAAAGSFGHPYEDCALPSPPPPPPDKQALAAAQAQSAVAPPPLSRTNNATSTPPASNSMSNGTTIEAAPDAHFAARRALSGSEQGRRLTHRPPARVEEAVRLVRQQAAEASRRQREAWVSRQLRAQAEGRRLKAVRGAFTSVAGVGITSQAYNPNQQWVLLRSLQTNTLIGVEPPPHAEAMGAHGRSDSISLKNVFAFFRGGYIWSRATDSLLNVCTTSHEICTGYLEKETDPHLKRLQHPMESARFTVIPVASAASSSNPNWTPA
ncbi:hypothetical protein AB1Y20_002397 [Prymnesium parvum]|uniref:Kringle domain-containing protein n=1 Tax=Prymnesium parvum TaxID=97485 RepID=A0AB34JAS6_PRYPA